MLIEIARSECFSGRALPRPRWVTRVGTATRGRSSVMSIRAFAALKAESAEGDVVCRKASVPF